MKHVTHFKFRSIILMCLIVALGGMSVLSAQNIHQINGVIIDSLTQEPLFGVNILNQNTSQGSVTDFDGNYSIEANLGDVLAFSYIGYESVLKKITSTDSLNIALKSGAHSLEELVVTGYSVEKKKDIIGSVSVVDMEAAKALPTGSTLQALQGQASGVNIISSGVPGQSGNIFIRGISSFGSTSPLILVDGIEASLDNINPNDIASVQILKDAGAASIYGVRGANGVIVVTTKKGETGAPVVNYNAYVGLQSPLKGNPFNLIMDTEEFARLSLIADPENPLFKDGIPDYMYAGPSGSGIGWEGDPEVDPSRYHFDETNPGNNYLIQKVNKNGTNWFHELFKPALRTDHNVSISGGTEKSKYYVSMGYLDHQGTVIETYVKRYSGRVNTSFKIGEHINLGQNLNIYYRNNPGFSTSSQFSNIAAIARMMPIIPTHDIMGNYGGTRAGTNIGTNQNPVADQERSANNNNNSWNGEGNIFIEINFLKDFIARTSFGGGLSNNYNYGFNYTPYERSEGFQDPNSYSESASFYRRLTWTNTLAYQNTFGGHDVSVLVGSEAIESFSRSLSGSRQNYFTTDPDYWLLSTGTTNIANGSSAGEEALSSYFSKVDYNFDDKYLVSGTVRRDGSSRFGPNSRYGVFSSASMGWRLSEESFMQDISWINDFKVRGSYGVMGSQNNVDALNQFDLYGGNLGNAYYDIKGTGSNLEQGFYQTRSGNPRTSWERNIVSNFGFDASLFSYRFIISVEYYKKAIDGLLFSQSLPAIAGGAIPATVNVGDIQNKGLDVTLGYNQKQSKDYSYSISINFTTYKNEVVNVPEPGYFDAGSHQQLGTIVRNQEGESVSAFYGYKVIDLFRSTADVESSPDQQGAAPGRFKYQDVNNDGVITPDDRTFLGSPNPDFTAGVNLNFRYKNLDASAILYSSYGNEAVNTIKTYTDFFGTYTGIKSNKLSNAWSPDNPNSNIPVIENQNSFSTAGVFNSYFVEDASFLKLRSLMIGYSIANSPIVEAVKVDKFRIYLQASNLFTLTKYTGLDPEIIGSTSSFGVDWANYPNNELVLLLGVNLTF